MAIQKVTYDDKVDLQIWASIPNTNKIKAQDMNEIKGAINENADELSSAKDEIANQDSEIEALMKALPSETQEGETVNIKGTIPVKFKEFVVGGNSKQESREGYNLLKYNDDLVNEYVINGITFTINDDKSITANGTATANASFNFVGSPNVYPLELESGDYVLSGCKGGSSSTYYMETYDGSNYRACTNGKATLNYSSNTNIRAYIAIKSGVTVNNVKFYPMIVKGTEEKDYEPYGAMPSTEFPSPVKCVGDNVNYFNKDTVTEGKYLTYQGQEVANTVWTYSDFISCTPNENWIISGYNTIGGAPARCFYNKDKELISGGAHNSQTNMMSFTTPNNCYYFRDSIAKADIDTVKIEKGDTATSYSKFGEGSTEIKKVNKNLLNDTAYKNVTIVDINSISSIDYQEFNNFKKGKTYIVRIRFTDGTYVDDNNLMLYGYNSSKTNIATIPNTAAKVYDNANEIKYVKLQSNSTGIEKYKNKTIKGIQIEEGSDDTDYVKHEETDSVLPVQQEMLEGDYFDLENGKEVHKFIKKKITSADGWFIGTNPNQETTSRLVISFSVPGLSADKINVYSNYFPAKTANYLWNNEEIGVAQSQSQLIIRVKKSEFPDTSTFNNFIDTHDVYIYCTAPEPIELDLTEKQKEVLNSLVNSKAFEGETNIFSTDAVSPIFKVTAVQNASVLLSKTTELEQKIDTINELLSTTATSAMLLDNLQTDLESEVI